MNWHLSLELLHMSVFSSDWIMTHSLVWCDIHTSLVQQLNFGYWPQRICFGDQSEIRIQVCSATLWGKRSAHCVVMMVSLCFAQQRSPMTEPWLSPAVAILICSVVGFIVVSKLQHWTQNVMKHKTQSDETLHSNMKMFDKGTSTDPEQATPRKCLCQHDKRGRLGGRRKRSQTWRTKPDMVGLQPQGQPPRNRLDFQIQSLFTLH